MTDFLLIRHGEPDYKTPIIDPEAGLTALGIQKSILTAKKPELIGTGIVVSSPTKRTLQTAGIISDELEAPLVIESGVREWMPDLENLLVTGEVQAQRFQKAFVEYVNGVDLGNQPYEKLTDAKKRALDVLIKYLCFKKVVVVTHAGLMKTFSSRKYRYCCSLPIRYDKDTINEEIKRL